MDIEPITVWFTIRCSTISALIHVPAMCKIQHKSLTYITTNHPQLTTKRRVTRSVSTLVSELYKKLVASSSKHATRFLRDDEYLLWRLPRRNQFVISPRRKQRGVISSTSVYVCSCMFVCGIIAPKRMNRLWFTFFCLKSDLIESHDLRKCVHKKVQKHHVINGRPLLQFVLIDEKHSPT